MPINTVASSIDNMLIYWTLHSTICTFSLAQHKTSITITMTSLPIIVAIFWTCFTLSPYQVVSRSASTSSTHNYFILSTIFVSFIVAQIKEGIVNQIIFTNTSIEKGIILTFFRTFATRRTCFYVPIFTYTTTTCFYLVPTTWITETLLQIFIIICSIWTLSTSQLPVDFNNVVISITVAFSIRRVVFGVISTKRNARNCLVAVFGAFWTLLASSSDHIVFLLTDTIFIGEVWVFTTWRNTLTFLVYFITFCACFRDASSILFFCLFWTLVPTNALVWVWKVGATATFYNWKDQITDRKVNDFVLSGWSHQKNESIV